MSESDTFSPYKSPGSPLDRKQGQQVVTGHLRKLKDIAADVHNWLEKWETLTVRGNSILAEIVNTKLKYIYQQNAESDGREADKMDVISLALNLQPKCEALLQVCHRLGEVVSKLTTLASSTRGVQALCQHRGDADGILFISWTTNQFVDTLEKLHGMYVKELSAKMEIAKAVALAETSKLLMFYSASWMHQPYLDSQLMIKALLMETGHQAFVQR